jgi:hypothetical protein
MATGQSLYARTFGEGTLSFQVITDRLNLLEQQPDVYWVEEGYHYILKAVKHSFDNKQFFIIPSAIYERLDDCSWQKLTCHPLYTSLAYFTRPSVSAGLNAILCAQIPHLQVNCTWYVAGSRETDPL